MTPNDRMRAAELACRCVLRLGRSTLPVDPYTMLRYSRGVYLYPLDELPGRILSEGRDALQPLRNGKVAAVSFSTDPDHCVICYQPEAYPPRLLFSMAHELGHLVLRHCGGPSDRASTQERMADLFASCLLMPPPLLSLLAREHGGLYAEQLAGVFGVSPLAAFYAASNAAIPLREETRLAIEQLLLETARRRFPTRVSGRWHPMPPMAQP